MTERAVINFDQTKGNEYRLPCLRCRVNTRHKVLRSVEVTIDAGHMMILSEYQVVQCLGCEEVSFRQNWQSDDDAIVTDEGETELIDHEEIFPPRLPGRSKLNDSHFLPYALRGLYDETYKALCSQQPILAQMGIRSLIEAVCRERNASGNDLEAKIESLVNMGDLTKAKAKILHDLRLLGNEVVHEIKQPSGSDLEVAFDAIEHLLRDVFLLSGSAARIDPVLKALNKARGEGASLRKSDLKAIQGGLSDLNRSVLISHEDTYSNLLGSPPATKSVGWKIQWSGHAEKVLKNLPKAQDRRPVVDVVQRFARLGRGSLFRFWVEKREVFQLNSESYSIFFVREEDLTGLVVLNVVKKSGRKPAKAKT